MAKISVTRSEVTVVDVIVSLWWQLTSCVVTSVQNGRVRFFTNDSFPCGHGCSSKTIPHCCALVRQSFLPTQGQARPDQLCTLKDSTGVSALFGPSLGIQYTVLLRKCQHTTPVHTPVRLPVAHSYVLHRMHALICMLIAWVCHKLQRISCLRHLQLRCQACASAFIPSVIGCSASSRVLLACVFSSRCLLSFRCYRSTVWAGCSRVYPQQLKMVYLRRLCEAENSVFPVLPSRPIKGSCCSYSEKTTATETKTDRVPRSHLLDSEIVKQHCLMQIYCLRKNAQADWTNSLLSFLYSVSVCIEQTVELKHILYVIGTV